MAACMCAPSFTLTITPETQELVADTERFELYQDDSSSEWKAR